MQHGVAAKQGRDLTASTARHELDTRSAEEHLVPPARPNGYPRLERQRVKHTAGSSSIARFSPRPS